MGSNSLPSRRWRPWCRARRPASYAKWCWSIVAAPGSSARSPWLMFLPAGAGLGSGWIEETTQFIQRVSNSGRSRAGIFRYARSPYADPGLRDGLKFVARMLTGPSAEQGLLIARDHYDRLGGYRPGGPRAGSRPPRPLGPAP